MPYPLFRVENPLGTERADSVRRRTIPPEERIQYTDAVNCLMNTPDVYQNISGSK